MCCAASANGWKARDSRVSDSTANPRRVLLTGASGAMGRVIGPGLVERGHFVRGFSRRPAEGFTEMHTGDLTDRHAVERAVAGMDTIVHLAAYPNPADLIDVLLEPNVIGLYEVMRAAVEHAVRRVVLASTIQVVSGLKDRARPRRIADGTAPTNHYALTKVWAEAMGEMYARQHGLGVLAVRICWFVRNASEARRLEAMRCEDLYFSPPDAVRFYTCAVEAGRPAPGEFTAVFAASKPRREPVVDLEPARQRIGYEPQDIWPRNLGFEY